MPVALLLRSVLENHGNTQDQYEVNANNPKGCRKDQIEIPIGKGGKLGNAAALLCSNKGIETSAILYERGRGRIDVSTTVELCLCQLLTVVPQ